MADEDSQSKMVRNITICIIVAASAGAIMTIYRCLNLGRTSNNDTHLHNRRQTFGLSRQDHQAIPSSIAVSISELIPSYKYNSSSRSVVESDDGMCPVCLSNFEDGEEVRMLPGCLHCFHAPCIDMWLFSHPNCPVCRTIATPSPRRLLHEINSNSESPVAANMQDHYIS